MAEFNEEVIFARLLEERLNDIGNSKGNALYEGALNLIEGQMVSDSADMGITYLLNYQTMRIGDYMNLSAYSQTFYPFINKAFGYADEQRGIPLGESDDENQIIHLLNNRRSVRKYSGKPVSFKILSNLLIGLQKVHHVGNMSFRNTPSGGGLYPVRIYFHANRVEGLSEGIYCYQPNSNTVVLIKEDARDEVKEVYLNQTVLDMENYNVLFMFAFDYTFCFQKYNNLALSLGFLESGMFAENIHLIANSYGLGTCDIGGCDKIKAEELMGIDGFHNHYIYSLILGDREE